MKTYRIILTPTSSIDGFPASDTLFGAMCWGIKAIHGEGKLCKKLERFDKDDPPFVLSSSFPVLEANNGRTYFYPTPCMPGPGMSRMKCIASECSPSDLAFKLALTRAVRNWKRFRKARFVSHELMGRLLAEGSLVDAFRDYHSGIGQPGGAVTLVSDDLLMTGDEYMAIFGDVKPPKLIGTAITQKNMIDRLQGSTGGAGELYYTSDTRLRGASEGPVMKLHFLLKTSDVDFLMPVFRWLADTGIGGNRSSGRNQFLVSEPEDAQVPEATPGDVFFTLSRCLPKPEGEEPLIYRLLPQRHRAESSHFRDSDIWKRKVIYFQEGSCFRHSQSSEYYGRIEEVKRIGHRSIRQNGLAFPIFGTAVQKHEAGA